jgi:hypothetical protein
MAGDYPLRQMANPPPVSALRPAGTYVLPMSQPSDIVNRSEEVPAPLPGPVGHLSWHVCELLRSAPQSSGGSCPTLSGIEIDAAREALDGVDPLIDDDLHLALYICFELGYRGFADVDPRWEGEIPLLQLRGLLEGSFLDALEVALPPEPDVDPDQVGDRLFDLERDDDGPPLTRFLGSQASIDQFREFVIHRSAYQLKEADPHSFAIPRLDGPPKAALLEIQMDEYGGGRSERMHSHLFATTMRGLGLDSRPNAFLDRLPGSTLATVNLMSALGTRRARRGAIVGHLAMFEMTSSRPNRAYGNGLRRLGADPATVDFYDEHVEADAVHENIAAYDLAGGLAKCEPGLAADILFGARALLLLESSFAARLLGAWEAGRTSLREPAASPALGAAA